VLAASEGLNAPDLVETIERMGGRLEIAEGELRWALPTAALPLRSLIESRVADVSYFLALRAWEPNEGTRVQ